MAARTTTFPYDIKDFPVDDNKEICEAFSNGLGGLVHVGPQKWVLPKKYEIESSSYYSFEVRPDDVWITGVPRSGTTLTEEMVWLILNDLDFETARNTPPLARIPFFEANAMLSGESIEAMRNSEDPAKRENVVLRINALEILEGHERRRVIKTHLPFCLLPLEVLSIGCKVVYVARSPEDVIVSYYHLQRGIPGRNFTGSLEHYFDLYLRNMIFYNPYWSHIEQAWEKRHLPNIKFIFYEDMTRNLRETITSMASFLEKRLTPSQLDSLEKVLGFHNFKKYQARGDISRIKDSDEDFVRKGQIGGSSRHFTREMKERARRWIQENSSRIGISYPDIGGVAKLKV